MSNPKISPKLEYIEATGVGEYQAHWGYASSEPTIVNVPVGSSPYNNRFHPTPQDRGQPTEFHPGRSYDTGPVTPLIIGQNLVWLLCGRTSTASAPSAPPSISYVGNEDLGDGTKKVTFSWTFQHRQTLKVPYGPLNKFDHADNAGQPSSFSYGSGQVHVIVPIAEIATWTLLGQTASES
jgi:hypothetical protein